MTLTEGLLIAIIIILVFVCVVRARANPESSSETRSWDCSDKNGNKVSVEMKYTHKSGCKCPQCMSPEKMATAENNEYFSGCMDPNETKKALDCLCAGDDKFAYASNDFGVAGDTYVDYVMKQSVDSQVFKNHDEFVKDRNQSTSQNITGKTYALGEIETEDIFWQGIRGRPQGIPGGLCNPLQVPEFSDKNYSNGPKMVWKST